MRYVILLLLGFTLQAQTITVNSGYQLNLLADYSNPSLNINLNGGVLFLDGYSLTIGSLSITRNSILDFGEGSSTFIVDVLNTNRTLNVIRWTEAQDVFIAQNYNSPSPSKVVFTDFNNAVGYWNNDYTIKPVVPEPSSYGALMGVLLISMFSFRRKRF